MAPVKIEDPGTRGRIGMLIGMGINAIGMLVMLSGVYSALQGRGGRAVGTSIVIIAIGTAVYYVSRFIVWLKTGKWDNTGLPDRDEHR